MIVAEPSGMPGRLHSGVRWTLRVGIGILVLIATHGRARLPAAEPPHPAAPVPRAEALPSAPWTQGLLSVNGRGG